MKNDLESSAPVRVSLGSSIEHDIWHPTAGGSAYDWWYFDALSDDGTEAVRISFHSNFVFPSSAQKRELESLGPGVPPVLPSVGFTYVENGAARYHSSAMFPSSDFSAGRSIPECRIERSSFKFQTAEYGSGYFVAVELPLSGGSSIEAHFEWLSIEADLLAISSSVSDHICWNVVAPRSDVTGRITVKDRSGRATEVRHFRGTGYHDHRSDIRPICESVDELHWGRVHFDDSTAVFCSLRDRNTSETENVMMVVREGKAEIRSSSFEAQNLTRARYGIRFPKRQTFLAEDNVRLRIKPIKVIESSFDQLAFLSEMTLTLRDGVARKTIGLSEMIAPRPYKYRWLNWLNRIRSGRDGKRIS